MKVFFSPHQNVSNNSSYSPSAGKPQKVVEQWMERWPDRIQVIEPQPVTARELSLAHDPTYVQEILGCRRHNGFGNLSRSVADSLPWTTGSFVSATRHVVEHGGVACSPTSGFHHACYARSGGFCTFNGLVVAAMLVHPQVERVGILDCDYHWGNGTDDILAQRRIRFVEHYTTGGPSGSSDAEAFLADLPELLESMQVNLLLYQAGADAHVDDPLGGWMSAQQMRLRDRLVFQFCRTHGIPIVWNLAGGYQEDFQAVLDLHHATMEECLNIFG